jgi:pyridoxal 5'-phosphate synthase pdxT subunit
VFIRAPQVARVGDGVEVIAEHAGVPVVVRQGHLLAAAFHPEIAGDPRLHRAVLESAG